MVPRVLRPPGYQNTKQSTIRTMWMMMMTMTITMLIIRKTGESDRVSQERPFSSL
ncbi:uncharacterized protein BDW47DRAFT_114503 [Aspergillus candidus]|uniref:Uncharacterized protein n=1 Tax=Aspergillus candidus TaxID=41067 RepID=A0A2I2EXQ1_ASPCN|nr:hypothetical protein BDW47DRAFT_114503 [Aspergillus candidus]PLB33166.1 hypothetical protein BDW47DRAFT_114503 [Aspergillus candidus]